MQGRVEMTRYRPRLGVKFVADMTMARREKIVSALPEVARQRLHRAELAQMACEYALFFVFVSGMCSGLGT